MDSPENDGTTVKNEASDYFCHNYLNSMELNVPLNMIKYIKNSISCINPHDNSKESDLNKLADEVEKFVLEAYALYRKKMDDGEFSIRHGFKGPITGIALYVEGDKYKDGDPNFYMLEMFNLFDITKEKFEEQVQDYLHTYVYDTAFDLILKNSEITVNHLVHGFTSIFGRHIDKLKKLNRSKTLKLCCCMVRDVNKVFNSQRIRTERSHEGVKFLQRLSVRNGWYKKETENKIKNCRNEKIEMVGTGEYFGTNFESYIFDFAHFMNLEIYLNNCKFQEHIKKNTEQVETNLINSNGPLTVMRMVGNYFIINIQNKYIKYNLISVSPFNTSIWYSYGLKCVLDHARGNAKDSERRGVKVNNDMIELSYKKVYPFIELQN